MTGTYIASLWLVASLATAWSLPVPKPTPSIPPALILSALAAFVLALASACTGGGPSIDPLDGKVAAVGSELVIEIRASNDNGADITFDYSTNATIDSARGGLTQRPGGSAVFAWTPSAQDIGTWTFDFHAVDNSGKSTESITVEVRSAIGLDTLPVFRRPLGAGTAIDAEGQECVEIEILIEDQDSYKVDLTQVQPVIEGAELIQEQDLSGFWRWCPSAAQKKAQDRYMLTIGADDGENIQALKHYQIILRTPTPVDCAGAEPEIRHSAANQETTNGIDIRATVSDDLGVKGSVNLYYSDTRPSDPPDLSRMILVPMELSTGTVQSGTWTATIPNPVADAPADSQAQIFYALVADDNDDKGGKCDHSAVRSFEMLASNPGGNGGLGLCESCTSDRQCGGENDLCLPVGAEAEQFCFSACESDQACPGGYTCSPEPLKSAEGGSARQCIPDDQSCSGLACSDDAFEQNDGKSQSQAIDPGTISDLRMCPFKMYAADEDWFELTIDEDSEVTFDITGGNDDPNLDLRMLDADGNLVAASEDFGSADSLSRCLTSGTYFVRVYSNLFYKTYTNGELNDMGNDYSISYTTTPSQCSTGGTCTDDAFEDDDGISSARIPDFGGLSDVEWRSSGNSICSADQDWYYISAYNNFNRISVNLKFEQTFDDEDLDILIYNGVGDLMTKCIDGDTSGCSNNGQSGTSNEYLSFQPPPECSLPIDCQDCEPCDYYVVVNGFGGAENDYDICIGYDSGNTCLQ